MQQLPKKRVYIRANMSDQELARMCEHIETTGREIPGTKGGIVGLFIRLCLDRAKYERETAQQKDAAQIALYRDYLRKKGEHEND